MEKQSKFSFLIYSNANIKKQGYSYSKEGNIFSRYISSYIYFNKKLQPFIHMLEKFINFSIKSIKDVKKIYNFMIPKDFYDFD